MFQKQSNNNGARLFFPLLLSVCLLGSNVFAMDEEDPISLTPQILQHMSRTQLEDLILKQQAILKGMSEPEKKIAEVLNTPLSEKVVSLLGFLKICIKEKLPFLSALDQACDGPIHNKALRRYMRDETVKNLTIRDVLKDEETPEYISRRLFRGVLCSTEEGTLINFSHFQFLGNKPADMNDWITIQLTLPHLNKILYLQNSLTHSLIEKYLKIRRESAFITVFPRKKMEYCLF